MMGDPKKTRKHFKRPLKIWDNANIAKEKVLVKIYGLKNKREIWKANTMLSKKRFTARSLLAKPLDERLSMERELLHSLARQGILDDKATIDDVLTLSVESLLERRLQTMVWRKGLANTAIQARQFITHGHIAGNGKRVDAPSRIITADEEKEVGYYAGRKMELSAPVKEKPAKKEEKAEKSIRQEFEESKPAEEAQNAVDVMAAIKAARAAKEAKGTEDKEESGKGEEEPVGKSKEGDSE